MGTKNNPGAFDCHEKALPDEPMFTVLARDPDAPNTVRGWAKRYVSRNRNTGGGMTKEQVDRVLDKAIEAKDCADAMDAWRRENPDV